MSTGNSVIIAADECKGCRLCVQGCPHNCLVIGSAVNAHGYQYARFEPGECTACGFCFYLCPEPGAITVISEGG